MAKLKSGYSVPSFDVAWSGNKEEKAVCLETHNIMCSLGVTWLPNKDIATTHAKYRQLQRTFDAAHALNVKSNWYPKAVSPLKLVPVTGTNLCLDGQHTRWALLELGFKMLPVHVYPAMTHEEMARSVYLWNGGGRSKKAWPSVDLFRLALEMDASPELPQRQVYNAAHTACGVMIRLYADETFSSEWVVKSPAPLMRIFDKHGGASGVTRTLSIIRGVFCNESGAPLHGALLHDTVIGVGMWQHAIRVTTSVSTLIKRLNMSDVTPISLEAEAARRLSKLSKSMGSRYRKTDLYGTILEDIIDGKDWVTGTEIEE